jgi:hypothetical protein
MAKKITGKNHNKEAPERAFTKDITAPRDELGTSDEIVMSGRVYYAENESTWDRDENRQYIASPDDMKDLQHGVVTYIDAAGSDKGVNEELDRRYNQIIKDREHQKKKPPEYEL